MSPKALILPYPYDTLPAVSRSQVKAGRALREQGDLAAVLSRLTAGLETWSGEQASFDIRRVFPSVEVPTEPRPRLLIRFASAPWTVLCCLDPRLCLAVAQRLGKAIGGHVETLLDPLPPIEPSLLGAVAALGSHLVDQAQFGIPIRIGWGKLPESIGTRVTVEGVLHWGSSSFEMVLTFDWPWLSPPAEEAHGRLSRLGACPLTVPLVAGSCRLTRTELSALGKGAVLLLAPGDFWIDRSAVGKGTLAAPDSDWGYPCELLGSGRIVLGPHAVNTDPEAPELAPPRPDRDLRTSGGSGQLGSDRPLRGIAQVLSDVPVTVRIEVGSVTLPAGQFAALKAGDVIETAGAVGDPVTLRSGGHALARGELVNVEGQLGVRILELLTAEAP